MSDDHKRREARIDGDRPEEEGTTRKWQAGGLNLAASGEFTSEGNYDEPTVEMPPGTMAKKVAANHLAQNIEVTGEVGDATRQLAWESRHDPDATLDVPRPSGGKTRQKCRMCGRGVGDREPRRFRGPIDSKLGFHCEACGNVFCAGHAVRVSPIFASFWQPARFRCQLCVPDGHR